MRIAVFKWQKEAGQRVTVVTVVSHIQPHLPGERSVVRASAAEDSQGECPKGCHCSDCRFDQAFIGT